MNSSFFFDRVLNLFHVQGPLSVELTYLPRVYFLVADNLFCSFVSKEIWRMTFYFHHCHHSSFLPNNQILFPTVQPESEQETVPLPDSAEPKWPRVSFGNTDDALLSIYNHPPFLAACVYLLQLSPWEGAWSGKCSCFDWLFASMPWAQLESRNEAWRWCPWRSGVESKFLLPRPLRMQPWLPSNHAAKSHVTAPTLPFCILNHFLFSSFPSLLTLEH